MHFDLQEHTFWANNLLKRGKRRLISDIRRSIGDGQTLVYVLETLGKNWASLFDIDIIQYLVACNVYDCFTLINKQSEYRPSSIVDVCGPCFRLGNEASHKIIFPVFPYQESFLYNLFLFMSSKVNICGFWPNMKESGSQIWLGRLRIDEITQTMALPSPD